MNYKYPINKIRSDFLINNKSKYNNIYFDNASTTLKPISVINNIKNFYKYNYSIYKKGIYDKSINITNRVENSRKYISKFINANYKEIIFTNSSTESINLISNSLEENFFKKGDNIIITSIEHHSNILPWILLSKKKKIEIKILYINSNGNFNIDYIYKIINKNTKLVSISHISNILGIIYPIKDIISIIKEKNKKTLILIDGTQSIAHIKVDVKKINCDFYTFSGHKIYGPLGIGVLYVKNKIFNKMKPFIVGGSIIKNLYKNNIIYLNPPWKFEYGTINVSSILGLEESIKYVNNIGIENIYKWEYNLTKYTLYELKKNIKNILIYGNNKKLCIISFNIKNINFYDIGYFLNKYNISIRVGDHCSIPTIKYYKINGMCRISYGLYNNYNEISFFINKLNFIIKNI